MGIMWIMRRHELEMKQKHMGVSKNRGVSPQIIHFNSGFPLCSPSILGYRVSTIFGGPPICWVSLWGTNLLGMVSWPHLNYMGYTTDSFWVTQLQCGAPRNYMGYKKVKESHIIVFLFFPLHDGALRGDFFEGMLDVLFFVTLRYITTKLRKSIASS